MRVLSYTSTNGYLMLPLCGFQMGRHPSAPAGLIAEVSVSKLPDTYKSQDNQWTK